MDNRKSIGLKTRLTAIVLCISTAICTIGFQVSKTDREVYADGSKVITLGANLSEEQKQLMLNYFNVSENEAQVIVVTNEDEHRLLDGIATQQQIGTRTYSCSYIEPTNGGGIHIKTVNLNWVTSDMIRNALVTSGVMSCNVIAASPIEVSGTGALTGIFMAYETISGEVLPEEKKELACEELILTGSIANDIGQEEATDIMSELKEEIISNPDAKNLTENDILDIVEDYIDKYNITLNINISLTDDQKWQIVGILLKLAQSEYDVEEVRKAYEDVQHTVEVIQETKEEAMSLWDKIVRFFKDLWAKITGKYEEIKNSEEYADMKDTLGILLETDDSLLSTDTVVTTTDTEINELVEEQQEGLETGAVENNDNTEEDEHHWYDWILAIFNSGNKEESEETESQEQQKEQDESEGMHTDETTDNTESESNTDNSDTLKFQSGDEVEEYIEENTGGQIDLNTIDNTNDDNTGENNTNGTEESAEDIEAEASSEDGMLQYVIYDMESETETSN